MNHITFAQILTDLPDEIIDAAAPSYGRPGIRDAHSARAFTPEPQIAGKKIKKKSADSAPHWFTAAALAACMLFAVGVGVFLLRGQHDPLTEPESQTDSAVTDTPRNTGTDTAQPVLTVTAPADSGDIPFTEVAADYDAYDGSFSGDEQFKTESCILRSAEQLKENLIQPVKAYPAEYFGENALIFVSTVFSCTTANKPAVTKIICRDNTLHIYAKRDNAFDEAEEWWCTFLEVRKADIAGTDENIVFDLEVTERSGRKSGFIPNAAQQDSISAGTETEASVTEPPAQTEPAAEPDSSADSAAVTTAPPVTAAPETTVQTTTTAAPHKIMLMTSAEEVEREGDRMVGEYKRRLAQLRGGLADDAPRITLAEVEQMVSSGMDFRAVMTRLSELYPEPDYYGGSGLSLIEYWLDDSGTDYILLIVEQEDLIHVVHGDDRENRRYENLIN